MTHDEKILWMTKWARDNDMTLEFSGECGFGRECVGITTEGHYPDYEWYEDKTYERLDKNGEIWTPQDAYHKHPCVAVLGRGETAEAQLYDWLKWFSDNGFTVQKGDQQVDPRLGIIGLMLGKHRYARMAKS